MESKGKSKIVVAILLGSAILLVGVWLFHEAPSEVSPLTNSASRGAGDSRPGEGAGAGAYVRGHGGVSVNEGPGRKSREAVDESRSFTVIDAVSGAVVPNYEIHESLDSAPNAAVYRVSTVVNDALLDRGSRWVGQESYLPAPLPRSPEGDVFVWPCCTLKVAVQDAEGVPAGLRGEGFALEGGWESGREREQLGWRRAASFIALEGSEQEGVGFTLRVPVGVDVFFWAERQVYTYAVPKVEAGATLHWVLTKRGEGMALRGRVVDSLAGVGVEGAVIGWRPAGQALAQAVAGSERAITDAEGYFMLEAPIACPARLAVSSGQGGGVQEQFLRKTVALAPELVRADGWCGVIEVDRAGIVAGAVHNETPWSTPGHVELWWSEVEGAAAFVGSLPAVAGTTDFEIAVPVGEGQLWAVGEFEGQRWSLDSIPCMAPSVANTLALDSRDFVVVDMEGAAVGGGLYATANKVPDFFGEELRARVLRLAEDQAREVALPKPLLLQYCGIAWGSEGVWLELNDVGEVERLSRGSALLRLDEGWSEAGDGVYVRSWASDAEQRIAVGDVVAVPPGPLRVALRSKGEAERVWYEVVAPGEAVVEAPRAEAVALGRVLIDGAGSGFTFARVKSLDGAREEVVVLSGGAVELSDWPLGLVEVSLDRDWEAVGIVRSGEQTAFRVPTEAGVEGGSVSVAVEAKVAVLRSVLRVGEPGGGVRWSRALDVDAESGALLLPRSARGVVCLEVWLDGRRCWIAAGAEELKSRGLVAALEGWVELPGSAESRWPRGMRGSDGFSARLLGEDAMLPAFDIGFLETRGRALGIGGVAREHVVLDGF